MPPKKKIKLEEITTVYEDGFTGRTYDSYSLTENVVELIENVNYSWKVLYKVVDEPNSKKVEIIVDFDSRYLFGDKVTMFIYIEVAGVKIEKEVVLEKIKGKQQFDMKLTQFGRSVSNKDIKVSCDIGVSHAKYNAKAIGTEVVFTEPDRPHDVVLQVGDEKFYVLKQYLATWSNLFNTLFFGDSADKDQFEFKIDNVEADRFEELL